MCDSSATSGNVLHASRAYSSAWLERFPDKEEADGSSPSRPTMKRKPRRFGGAFYVCAQFLAYPKRPEM